MQLTYTRHEIDHHVLKLIVGAIAFALPMLTAGFSPVPLGSISEAYHQGGWARDVFVGFLFAIGAFLLAYNGEEDREMVLSKVAALASIGIAMFPCRCGDHAEVVPYLHYACAAVMFACLVGLCLVFSRRAQRKAFREALRRAWIYRLCAGVIVAAMAAVALDALGGDQLAAVPRLVFYAEFAALAAFGVAWSVASRTLWFLAGPGLGNERVSVLPVRFR